MSVISVFDGGSCALFDGWIGVDRFPDAIEHTVVLAAVKDASRRGPSKLVPATPMER
jgi:hypothetical protein